MRIGARAKGNRLLDSPNHNNQTKGKDTLAQWMAYPITILLEVAVTAGLLALHPYFPTRPVSYSIRHHDNGRRVLAWRRAGRAGFCYGPRYVRHLLRSAGWDLIWPPADSPEGWARFLRFSWAHPWLRLPWRSFAGRSAGVNCWQMVSGNPTNR